jgi:peptidoglycan/LPS O-acetylase OafA/YrhL
MQMNLLSSFTDKYILGVKPGMFRLFLATLVVLHHGLRVFPVGAFAVYAFFILSGYWVSRMYDEFYAKKKNAYRLFIYSRILRLYPLYLLCTVCMILVSKFIILKYYQISLTPELGIKEYSFMGLLVPLNLLKFKLLNPAWSLAVEMQFYIIAPVIILLIRKMNSILLFVLMLSVSVFFTFNDSYKFNETVLAYLVYFLIGMLIYFKAAKVSRRLLYISLLCIVAVILVSYGVPSLRFALLYRQEVSGSYGYYQFFNQVMPFLFIPFIIHNLSQKSDTMDRHFGDFSYTIYLVHWIVFSVYFRAYPGGGVTKDKLIGFGITMTAVIVLSLVIYYFFEKRVETLRKKLIKS